MNWRNKQEAVGVALLNNDVEQFMKTDLSSFQNNWYQQKIGASTIKQILWYYCNLIFFRSGWLPISSLKCFLLRLFGAKLGTGVVLKPHLNIKYPWKLEIGNHSWIGENVWIDNLEQVVIGNHCCVSQGAMLLTGNHNYKKSGFDLVIGAIQLEDGAWVGAQSVVCPGVAIGSHAVLSVQSVATQSLEPYGIYQGNPAVWKKMRTIEE